MSKELIQDIKRPKRPLADVLPKERREPKPARATPAQSYEPFEPPPRSAGGARRTHSRRRGGLVWTFALILVIALVAFYLGSRFLAQAAVVVSPRHQIFSVDTPILALAEGASNKGFEGPIVHFRTMTVRAEERAMLKATGRTEVSERASGEILISNRHSESPQKLIINTRFATEAGKIYRIQEPVTIPGYQRQGEEILPGELRVTVYADEPGADYNGELGALTIPGFEGDPRFETIRARGVTPATGGFTGERLTVSPSDRSTLEDQLTESLREKLETEAVSSLPPDFISFPELTFLDFQSEILEEGEIPNLVVRGDLVTAIFPREELSRELARVSGGFELQPAEALIANLGEFTLVPPSSSLTASTLTEIEQLNPRLKGEARLVWQFDEIALAESLAGVSEADYDEILAAYPAILRTEIAISPPWLNRFPAQADRIEIRLDR